MLNADSTRPRMIYEMRTFDLQPGMVPEFAKRYAAALPQRTQISPLGAFWQTEVGPLNQAIVVWPYKDLAERGRVRAEASKLAGWPPPARELYTRQENKILVPAEFSPLH